MKTRTRLLNSPALIERLFGLCFAEGDPPADDGGGGGGDPAAAEAAAAAATAAAAEQAEAWKATRVTLAGGDAARAQVLEAFDGPDKLFGKLTEAAPADWREQMAGGDTAELEFLKRYTDPVAARKAWKAASSKITDGGLVKIPGADATPEEIAEYTKALGVPESADKYQITAKPVDGYKVSENDTEFLTGMTARLHDAISKGAKPTEIVNLAHQLYFDAAADAAINEETARANAAADGEAENMALWGSKALYDQNIQYAIAAAKHFFPGKDDEFQALMGTTLSTGHALFDHPMVQRMFAQIGRQAGVVEDPFFLAERDGNKGFDPQKRKDEILAMRNGTGAQRAEYAKLSAPGGELERLNTGLQKKTRAA